VREKEENDRAYRNTTWNMMSQSLWACLLSALMSLAMLLLCMGHLLHAEESVSVSYIRIADRYSNYCTCNTHDATKTQSSISNHPITGNYSLHQTQVLEDPWARHIGGSEIQTCHTLWQYHQCMAKFPQWHAALILLALTAYGCLTQPFANMPRPATYIHMRLLTKIKTKLNTDAQLPFSCSITDAISASWLTSLRRTYLHLHAAQCPVSQRLIIAQCKSRLTGLTWTGEPTYLSRNIQVQ
jgi:hypothetical protein